MQRNLHTHHIHLIIETDADLKSIYYLDGMVIEDASPLGLKAKWLLPPSTDHLLQQLLIQGLLQQTRRHSHFIRIIEHESHRLSLLKIYRIGW